MEIIQNDIFKTYLLDFDINIDGIGISFKNRTPKTIINLCEKVKENSIGIYSHKKTSNEPLSNKTEREASLNEIYFIPENLKLKRISHKKYLEAYIASAYYLSNFLSNKYGEKFTVVVNYFISKEISHDLRYYKLRNNESWIPFDFKDKPIPSGIFMILS